MLGQAIKIEETINCLSCFPQVKIATRPHLAMMINLACLIETAIPKDWQQLDRDTRAVGTRIRLD